MTAPWSDSGTRSLRPEEVEANLAEALRCAVPLHVAEMRGWTPDRRRRVGMPHGWTAHIGLADSMLFGTKIRGRAELAFTTWARGLAVLAYEPGGVTLFGVHFCAVDHDGCPAVRPAAKSVDPAATLSEFHRVLGEYEALLCVEERATA
jgi:hypothetical protein